MESIKDLLAARERLDELLENARQKAREAALKEIKTTADLHGIDIIDVAIAMGLRPRKTGATHRPARYFDPVTGRSWTGEGRLPWWLENKDISHYEIRRPKRSD